MPDLLIVSAFPHFETFVASAWDACHTDLTVDYRRQVIDPVWEAVVAGGEIAERGESLFAMSFDDLDSLAAGARFMREAGVEETVAETFRACNDLLPGPDTAIGVVPADPANELVREQMRGVLGWAPGGGRIVLFLIPDAAPDWLDWVRYTVAHEYHHSVWRHRFPYYGDFSLLEYLIFEGRADSFARAIVPEITPPWVDTLSVRQQQEAWVRMQPHLSNRDREQVLPFIYGGSGIPRWAGYTIGYRIVQAYLRRYPEASVGDWTDLTAEEMLEQSGYNNGEFS